MATGLVDYFKRRLGLERPLHPIDRRMARHWVKQRLVHIFPELRGNPEALEQAYRELDLEARPGGGRGGETVFEAIIPRQL